MGNQILALVKQDVSKQQHLHVKKSIIRPIKYGYQRPPCIQITHNIKQELKHNTNSLEQHHIQLYQDHTFPLTKNPQQCNQRVENKMQMYRELSSDSEESYRKLQSIKNDKNFNHQHLSTSQMIKVDLRKPTESRPTLKNTQVHDEQVIINYLPNVSKMISILKPFQNQLALLDDTKTKKIRIPRSGDIYKGQLNDFNQPHGLGMLIKQNGSTLIGKFEIGLLQNHSVFIYSNGSYYKGNMLNSMATDPNGQFHSVEMTYVGGFQNNSFHGDCQELGNDHHFKGQYEINLRKKGILSWQIKSNSKNMKQYKQNQTIQKTNQNEKTQKYIEKDSQKIEVPPIRDFKTISIYNFTYEGQFDVHQLFTGKGVLKDPQGTYIGQFYRGMKHGKGEYQYESQIKYIGNYDSDKRSGYGILMNCDNTISYEGQWRNGLPNGKGCSYDLKGRKTQSEFVDGLPGKIIPLN